MTALTFFPAAPEPKERVRNLTGRAARRRDARKACCALCARPLAGRQRMTFRLPDPRPEKWGVMATGEGHPQCVALAERRRAEAAEHTLAALSDAAKAQKTANENAGRQQAMGLWTPRQGAQ